MTRGAPAPDGRRRGRALKRGRLLYLALTAWQPVWLGLLPAPAGKASWAIAIAATLPLLVPLYGIVRCQPRAMVWGGYLALLYFMFGVMEWWSAPGQAWTAGLTILLSVAFLAALAVGTRKQPRNR